MNRNNFPFEHFTLIMTRNCNLKCEYCPLTHSYKDIEDDVIDIFFENIIKYNNYNFNITLFGGEPLLNKKGIENILRNLDVYKKEIISNNIYIYLKIPTNGTILNDDYIELFTKIRSFQFVDLSFNVSIDGKEETQLKQRGGRNGHVNYFGVLKENIKSLTSNNFKVELSTVLFFSNENIFEDIVYLVGEFKVPIFIMPVELTMVSISKYENITYEIKKYLINIEKALKLLEKNNLTKFILNYSSYVDIRAASVGPTIDINGDIYTSRCFLFPMDNNSIFSPVGNIRLDNLISYFENNSIMEIEKDTLNRFFGKTYTLNMKIGAYFTKLVYKR